MGKYFGTDGFRGEAGVDLTSFHAYRIGRFLGQYFKREGRRVRGVIGKDTRRSSYMLEYAVASGIASSGGDAYMLHVTTTPCVSYAVSEGDFDFGIMISASHNPFYDNGIKIVNSKGEKLDEKTVEQIERYLEGEVGEPPFATGAEIGEIVDYVAGRNRYVGYLISLSHHSFRGLKIGLDMANGGAWSIAKSVFDALGARTYVINAEPNGLNINLEAGSTHIEGLARLVREQGLDMGFAFDGDADRCIAVDERGQAVSGDGILYILARELLRQGELTGGRVVATVMSNLGLHRALGELGVGCEVTAVGDRFVYEKMVEGGYSLGGEESGHIILSKYATTGDGILTAIKVAEAMVEGKSTLSHLHAPLILLPQVTRSVRVKSKSAVMENRVVLRVAEECRAELSDSGRILLRASGTEPLVRIMVEAQSKDECLKYIEKIQGAIVKEGLI